ncbi:MAG: hypothetical protein SOW25_06775 [Helicobacter sp.]|nr:hypothetical protein [Helicobacter sp.]
MNYIMHTDRSAVNSCGNCGCGLCAECNANASVVDNKPLCNNCFNKGMDDYIASLKNALAQFNKQKKIWTIMLGVGIALILLLTIGGGLIGIPMGYIYAAIIWGFAGFFERVQKSVEDMRNESYFQALHRHQMYKDGSIWWLWGFKLIWFVIRGALFPIFYAIFIIKGNKEAEKLTQAIEEAEAAKIN